MKRGLIVGGAALLAAGLWAVARGRDTGVQPAPTDLERWRAALVLGPDRLEAQCGRPDADDMRADTNPDHPVPQRWIDYAGARFYFEAEDPPRRFPPNRWPWTFKSFWDARDSEKQIDETAAWQRVRNRCAQAR